MGSLCFMDHALSHSVKYFQAVNLIFQMSEIVNNPADRKVIIRDQSRLSKFLMFIPVAFCFFCFVILSCIDVWKTHFVHLPCFAVWKEGQGRFKPAISVHITNKNYLGRSSGTAFA